MTPQKGCATFQGPFHTLLVTWTPGISGNWPKRHFSSAPVHCQLAVNGGGAGAVMPHIGAGCAQVTGGRSRGEVMGGAGGGFLLSQTQTVLWFTSCALILSSDFSVFQCFLLSRFYFSLSTISWKCQLWGLWDVLRGVVGAGGGLCGQSGKVCSISHRPKGTFISSFMIFSIITWPTSHMNQPLDPDQDKQLLGVFHWWWYFVCLWLSF